MFLTIMTPTKSSLAVWVSRLPQPPPLDTLMGRRPGSVLMPDNIVCFQRRQAADLNRPRRGRALHHRCVLIVALKTAAKVCVDDRIVPLQPGEGLLLLPFQFHHYLDAQRQALMWLFITFDVPDATALEPLRFHPFRLDASMRSLTAELLRAYQQEGRDSERPVLLLGLLLARLRRLDRPQSAGPSASPEVVAGLMMRVNQLVQKGKTHEPLEIREVSRRLGISVSHLRARFRASCGVSLGRHLRHLRLERACGLLRLSTHRVTEISELCGFSSIYHFSRAFRTAYGISPLDYRRQNRA